MVGYVLLADARSIAEVASGTDLTLDYVDLSVLSPEDAELFHTFTGRSFRVAVSEVPGIESNLAIANMDFHEFADSTAVDGVFRGFSEAVVSEPAWPAERAPGLAAARAVLADLLGSPGSRRLTGDLGQVTIDVEVPGTRTRAFSRVGSVFGWPPCLGGSGWPEWEVGAENFYDATLPEFMGVYEQHGHIRTELLEVDRPSRLVKSWNWLVPGPGDSPALRDHQRLLEEDAILTLAFEKSPAHGADASTRVRLAFVGIPAEWVEDFEALFNWDIARFATQT